MRISDWSSDVCSSDLVVFDLFQDLDGFSLDEYQPFSDVSTGMERIVQFMSSSLPDRHQRLAKVDDQTYDLTVVDGSRKVRFTPDRDEIGRASCRGRVCQ